MITAGSRNTPQRFSAFGSVAADAGRGLALRLDHGTQYLSVHFQNQIKYWRINPSFAVIEQPPTNGVAERFMRTLKEQVIYGRVFQNLKEVRAAVGLLVDTCNRAWRVEKNGFPGRPKPSGSTKPHSPGRLRKTWVQETGCATLGPHQSGNRGSDRGMISKDTIQLLTEPEPAPFASVPGCRIRR